MARAIVSLACARCPAAFHGYAGTLYCPTCRPIVKAEQKAAGIRRWKEKNAERVSEYRKSYHAANKDKETDYARQKYREQAEERKNRFIMRKYGYATVEEAQRHRDAFHARHRRDVDQLSKERHEIGY